MKRRYFRKMEGLCSEDIANSAATIITHIDERGERMEHLQVLLDELQILHTYNLLHIPLYVSGNQWGQLIIYNRFWDSMRSTVSPL